MDLISEGLQCMMEPHMQRRWRDSLPPALHGIRNIYGGFIGEELSQDSPAEVWAALRRLGVTQIIDLRHNYGSETFKSRCMEYGISYYNYPIHNDAETIASMVDNYSQFTELLYNGGFYMQGCYTAYVALCLYWSLSKCPGLYPYELRREVKRNRQLMEKVVPILYAMDKYAEKRYENEEYMPANYYEQQREQIKDFIENDGPKTASYSVFVFTRVYRNETVVYDISLQGVGVVGYLYAPKRDFLPWEYDIVLHPSVSDKARNFGDAQVGIARHLCNILPVSIKWVALPESVRTSILLLRTSLD